jgi:hypothetical protein
MTPLVSVVVIVDAVVVVVVVVVVVEMNVRMEVLKERWYKSFEGVYLRVVLFPKKMRYSH